jgi:hypothetical protein
MTTKHSPAAKLQDTILRATHAQRCLALTNCMDALIDLGFYEDEPINGGDAVDEVARAFGQATTHDLKPGLALQFKPKGSLDDVLNECATYLREIQDQTRDGSEDDLPDLVKAALKLQMATHVKDATESQVLAATTHMLSALREMGFDRDDAIIGGDAVEALGELYKSMAKRIFGSIELAEADRPGMLLLDSCREYLQDIRSEDLDGSEPNLDEVLDEVKKYLGPATLPAAEHKAAWSLGLASYSSLPESRAELEAKAQSLNLATISSRELIALERGFRAHDSASGFQKDSLAVLACSLEWRIRKLAEGSAEAQQADVAANVPAEEPGAGGELAPRWHLFSVEATGGNDTTGDLVAKVLVSALSGSRETAETLARAAVEDALPDSYVASTSAFVCESDRDVWMLVSSDEPLEAFGESPVNARTERPRG